MIPNYIYVIRVKTLPPTATDVYYPHSDVLVVIWAFIEPNTIFNG